MSSMDTKNLEMF